METLDLSDFFSTRSQAEDFSQRLTFVAKEAFATGFDPEKSLIEHLGIVKKEAFIVLMRNNNVNPQSRLSIKDFIDKVQAKIASFGVVSMVFAFEPTDRTLQALSHWFILNTNKQVLFDIKIDKSLVGGAAILSNGKYLDYSIRPALEKITNETLYGRRTPAKVNTGKTAK